MAKPRLTAPILLGVVTVLALVMLTGGDRDKERNEEAMRQTFEVGAVYHAGDGGSGLVEISYLDRSGSAAPVVLEVLGMAEPFQKAFPDSSRFVETVPFSGPPQNGWKAHPVIFKVDHPELGSVELKTEVHAPGQPAPPVVYSAGP